MSKHIICHWVEMRTYELPDDFPSDLHSLEAQNYVTNNTEFDDLGDYLKANIYRSSSRGFEVVDVEENV